MTDSGLSFFECGRRFFETLVGLGIVQFLRFALFARLLQRFFETLLGLGIVQILRFALFARLLQRFRIGASRLGIATTASVGFFATLVSSQQTFSRLGIQTSSSALGLSKTLCSPQRYRKASTGCFSSSVEGVKGWTNQHFFVVIVLIKFFCVHLQSRK